MRFCEVGACWQLVPSSTVAGLSEAARASAVLAVNCSYLVACRSFTLITVHIMEKDQSDMWQNYPNIIH